MAGTTRGQADETVCGPAEGGAARRPRRDAERNRRRLLRAAVETFRDDGLDVVLDTIARRAGVANATLYRHFPTREDLYEAVFADARERVVEVLDRYQQVQDGWSALQTFIVEISTVNPAGSAMQRLADQRLDVSPALVQLVDEVRRTLRRLLAVAQQQGTVRPDVDFDDLELLLTSHRPVMVAAIDIAPSLGRRQLALILDALRADGRSTLPAPEATPEQRERLVREVRK